VPGQDWQAVLAPPSMRELRERLRVLEARHEELHLLGGAMIRRFRGGYPDAPIYLVKYASRSLSEYRWRQRSGLHWGGEERRRGNVTLDLTTPQGQALLERFSLGVRQDWLQWEGWRVELNLALSTCTYERYRLRDYVERKRRMREMQDEWAGRPK
jgi:hypothetical protein